MKKIVSRYDSQPTQPPDCGDMTFAEQDDLFDETLEREDVIEDVWLAIYEGLTAEQYAEIVKLLFRRKGVAGQADFNEAGRLLHKWLHKIVSEIVEEAE